MENIFVYPEKDYGADKIGHGYPIESGTENFHARIKSKRSYLPASEIPNIFSKKLRSVRTKNKFVYPEEN